MNDAAWECVIGLEFHVQLATRTKLFSACPVRDGALPNRDVDAVSLGLPGTLPTLDRQAVHLGLRLAHALGAAIAPSSSFARKNYFYPDLPKNFQITQYEEPLATGGALDFEFEGERLALALERLHLEEDAGRSVHGERTLLDFDRAGVALVEVVTRPHLRSPEAAGAAFSALRELVAWTGVGGARLERGELRCDANVSVRRAGGHRLGTKVEVKNLNSIRHLVGALRSERERQVRALERGEDVRAQTRGYDPETCATFVQREKEAVDDYRYLPEPDLPPLRIDAAASARARAEVGELPLARRARLRAMHGLGEEDLKVLTATRARADYFEATVAAGAPARLAATWLRGELTRIAHAAGTEPETLGLAPDRLAAFLRVVEERGLPRPAARDLLDALVRSGGEADLLEQDHGRSRPLQPDQLRASVRALLATSPLQVARYREGKTGLLGWFTAQLLAGAAQGADPRTIQTLLRQELDG